MSLVLGAAKPRDHADDGDGAFGRPGLRGALARDAARLLAVRWAAGSERAGGEPGFEVSVLTDAIGRQSVVEAPPTRRAARGTR